MTAEGPGTGLLTLVGAGPGGADLITVRGAAALAKAEVVVFDRLVDRDLLELAPTSAEMVSVGKSKGAGSTQEEINDIIVDRALRGLRVVRLKGGDPFVFGRGSEESEAAARAGIRCEVVPGLSSALAAPGLAGIPLTHRGIAASFTVLSGHRIEGADHDWDALARSGSTLVVLMGASTARGIAARLLAGGRPHLEPVALIHNAGRSDQQVAALTLDRLLLEGCHFPSPVVIVVGEVVNLRDQAFLTNSDLMRIPRPLTLPSIG